MIRTNEAVQEKLTKAISMIVIPEETVSGKKVSLVKLSLELIALYSASGNSIPGLAGIGLEDALDIADVIIQNEGHIAHLHLNFRSVGSVLLLR